MDLDFEQFARYDLDALKQDLNSRIEQIKSLQWAINEHSDEISRLERIIAWKEQNGNKNGHNS
jgi:uncharacterized UPF0160 family protein